MKPIALFRTLMIVACLAGLVAIGEAAGTPPRRPALTFVGIRAVHEEPLEVEATRKLSLRGTVVVDGPEGASTLQVVITRVYDGHVWISPRARVEASTGPKRTVAWEIPDAELPPLELGAGYELQPVLFAAPSGLAGITDLESVRARAISFGDTVTIVVGTGDGTTMHNLACRVVIDAVENVYGSYVAATSADIEVSMISGVNGTVDAPPGMMLVFSVRPSGSPRRWLMPPNIALSGRQFHAAAFTGRENMDFGEEYALQAFLVRRPIATDRPYDPDDWAAVEPSICGRSRAVMVRRRVAPGDLRITHVDDVPVKSSASALETSTEPTVSGELIDTRMEHRIGRDETVWLLYRQVGTEGWIVGGLAVVNPDRLGWRVPALRLPQPGKFQIIAVAARTRLPVVGHVLSASEWFGLVSRQQLRRLSRAVQIHPLRSS